MEDVYTIHKDYSKNPSLDFAFLRQKGIDLIQHLSGKVWTDFNLHDPGVTILESICYTLTDLAYRTNFPIADLLADRDGKIDKNANSFVNQEEILSTNPVSVNDFCKWIIDSVEEVDNIRIEAITSAYNTNSLNGFYRTTILISPDHWQKAFDNGRLEELKNQVIATVRQTFAETRNVAEEYDEIIILEPQYIEISADIIINKQAVPEEVLASIYFKVQEFLNPKIKFFTEKELIKSGFSVEEIHDGPLLQNGIIPDSELTLLAKKVEVADLIRSVTELVDVTHIRSFHIREEGAEKYSDKPVILKQGRYPLLRQALSPDIRLYHDRLPLPLRLADFSAVLQRLHDSSDRSFIRAIHQLDRSKELRGKFYNTSNYTSLQQNLPGIYGLNYHGLDSNAGHVRKAQANQLKAYLLFFDQIMANYLSQLGNISKVFSPDLIDSTSTTYNFQPVYSIPGISGLLATFNETSNIDWHSFVDDSDNNFVKSLRVFSETDETYNYRKIAILDHLLSRFNIIPDIYPLLLFESMYDQKFAQQRPNAELRWKAGLLKNVLPLTKYRSKANNYQKQNQTDQLSHGFEHNMYWSLYIQHKKRGRLADTLERHIQQLESIDEDSVVPKSSPEHKLHQDEGEDLTILDDINADYDNYRIRNRSAKFLEWGLNEKNYRIIPAPGQPDKTLVLYKNPQERAWNIIRSEAGFAAARKGLSRLIKTLRQISIDSEGFHFVEHIMLAPATHRRVFGFTFRDRTGTALLREVAWLTFDERETVISRILHIANGVSEASSENWIGRLQGLCKIAHTSPGSHSNYISPQQFTTDTEDRSKIARNLLKGLKEYTADARSFFPAFEFSNLHSDGTVLPEGFFNAEVTVVLPAWPARFQQTGFRQFAEDSFMGQLPAHLKVNFLWLNIKKMKQFEDLFFDWLHVIKNTAHHDRQEAGMFLTKYLFNELKRN